MKGLCVLPSFQSPNLRFIPIRDRTHAFMRSAHPLKQLVIIPSELGGEIYRQTDTGALKHTSRILLQKKKKKHQKHFPGCKVNIKQQLPRQEGTSSPQTQRGPAPEWKLWRKKKDVAVGVQMLRRWEGGE